MVLIDDVYQKVLALANKEQRGYITPQEFNLLANKAQLEIFDSYFYDMKTAYHKPKNNINFSDEMEILEEKLQPFNSSGILTLELGGGPLPFDTYRLKNIFTPDGVLVTQVTEKEYLYITRHPLTKPTVDRPIYIRSGNDSVYVNPFPYEEATLYSATYWRKPIPPKWAYVIVQEKALYNANLTINFELHRSEEEPLVTRILQLAGVTIKKPDLIEVAMTDSARAKQEQNN